MLDAIAIAPEFISSLTRGIFANPLETDEKTTA